MKQLKWIFIFPILLFSTEFKEILLLHSYNDGLKWTNGITSGIREVLKDYPFYELSVDYMDSKKYQEEEYLKYLVKLYEKKFFKKKFDVIITADNYAYDFVLKYHKSIFKSSNIVFCGLENFKDKSINKKDKKYITGVVEYKDINENIKIIYKLIPDLETLYIISDNSFSSRAIKQQIIDSSKKFRSKFKVIFDDNIETDNIKNKIDNLSDNSVILFTSLYQDNFYNYISYEKLREFFQNSKIPIFALNKIHLGEGIVGGKLVEPIIQGKQAILKAINIIEGKLPSDIPISIPNSKYYFDYKVLEKFNIDILKLPLDSNIINRPKNFFEKYRKYIDSAFLLMPLLVLLTLGLIINLIKNHKISKKLNEQNILNKVLLNNIKSIIYWQSNEGILLGCNDSLCSLLKKPRSKILGKKMKIILPQIYRDINNFDEFICYEIEYTLKIDEKKIDTMIRRKKYFNDENKEAGIVTTIIDISKLKALKLRSKKDEQLMVQRSKLTEIGEMLTSIVHQWKTPLIEISTIAQELLYKPSLTKNESKAFVDDIMLQVQYMTNTIDDFKAFIKPSTKKRYFDIKSAINSLLKVVEHNFKYNYINVSIEYEKYGDLKIYGYENEFKQAILNILNNSKDSILKRKQKESINGEIKIFIKRLVNTININIIDNGIGIKEENLNKIFDPFFTSKKGGDGFGLYMVKLILEDKMNAKIEALKYENGANIEICLEEKK